jgi:hypothetical protein
VFVRGRERHYRPRGIQTGAYLKAVTYDMNDKFINNDHVSGNPNAFVGLKYRIANGVLWRAS